MPTRSPAPRRPPPRSQSAARRVTPRVLRRWRPAQDHARCPRGPPAALPSGRLRRAWRAAHTASRRAAAAWPEVRSRAAARGRRGGSVSPAAAG
eukprot:scaffold114607_cov60-Phaeocystis_antarctica.AAC.1